MCHLFHTSSSTETAFQYMSWISSGKVVFTIKGEGLAADPRVEIGPRPVPLEPMYIIFNLGISPNFGAIDFDHLTFPAKLKVDWVRVYQDPDAISYGCDPKDYPTAEYINTCVTSKACLFFKLNFYLRCCLGITKRTRTPISLRGATTTNSRSRRTASLGSARSSTSYLTTGHLQHLPLEADTGQLL